MKSNAAKGEEGRMDETVGMEGRRDEACAKPIEIEVLGRWLRMALILSGQQTNQHIFVYLFFSISYTIHLLTGRSMAVPRRFVDTRKMGG